MIGRGIVDDWSHERLRVGERLIDDQTVDHRPHGVEQLGFLPFLDDQAPCRGASLASGKVSRLDDDRRCGLNLLGVPDHERIVAAKLQRQDLVGHVSELAVKGHSRARRSGEQETIYAGFRRESLALLRAANEKAHHALGDTRLVKAFDEESARPGGFLGRLEHHRIARDQRGDDMAVGQVRGKIVRPENGEHAMRLVA